MTAAPEPKDAALFSELGRATRGLLLVARTRPLAIVAAISAGALIPSCACLVGLLLVPFVTAVSVWIARGAFPERKAQFDDLFDVPLIFLHALVPVVAVVALAASAWLSLTPVECAVATCLATTVAGALFGLVAGTTFRALGSGGGGAIESALGDTVRVGVVRRAVAGAVIGFVTTGLPLAPAIFLAQQGDPFAHAGPTLAAYAALALGQGTGLIWMLALGVPPDDVATASSQPARRLLSRIFALGTPIIGLVALALAFAAARPSAAHSEPTSAERATARPIDDSVSLPGEHGLVVRRVTSGVVIETVDGGGAGEVDLNMTRDAGWATLVSERGPGPPGSGLRYAGTQDEGWIVFEAQRLSGAPDPERVLTLGVRFDARGVRTDDGLVDRIAWRFGALGLVLLLVSLLLAAPFLVVLARGIGSATTLDRGEAGGDYAAWSGALELDADREPRVERGRLVAADGARLVRDGSDGVVTLAAGALVLGPDGPLASGTRVSVVARSDRLATLGPRSGSVAWPKDAWLVVGSLDAAKDRIVRTSLRTAALFGVPSALAALVACVASLLSS